jgi:hypothetical protein
MLEIPSTTKTYNKFNSIIILQQTKQVKEHHIRNISPFLIPFIILKIENNNKNMNLNTITIIIIMNKHETLNDLKQFHFHLN